MVLSWFVGVHGTTDFDNQHGGLQVSLRMMDRPHNLGKWASTCKGPASRAAERAAVPGSQQPSLVHLRPDTEFERTATAAAAAARPWPTGSARVFRFPRSLIRLRS